MCTWYLQFMISYEVCLIQEYKNANILLLKFLWKCSPSKFSDCIYISVVQHVRTMFVLFWHVRLYPDKASTALEPLTPHSSLYLYLDGNTKITSSFMCMCMCVCVCVCVCVYVYVHAYVCHVFACVYA